jgi:hypothetical protein
MINIINRKWLPRTLPALAAWFANFAEHFGALYAQLGFKSDVLAEVTADNSTVQWLNDAMAMNEANGAALRHFRDATLYGEKNDAAPTNPSMMMPSLPPNLSHSIIQRVVALAEKIQLADGYTEDLGAQLGIVVPKSDGVGENAVKPSVKVFPAAENHDFAVVVENRGRADQSELQYRVMGQETWKSLKIFTGKSCDAQFAPATDGQPVQVQVRVQLHRKNQKYGQPSDAVYATLNP